MRWLSGKSLSVKTVKRDVTPPFLREGIVALMTRT